jgi:hypothetical protein
MDRGAEEHQWLWITLLIRIDCEGQGGIRSNNDFLGGNLRLDVDLADAISDDVRRAAGGTGNGRSRRVLILAI